MKKILRFLKPYAGWVAVCFVLLFAQAMCDLNLPNLMSDIINIGVQQNGIEEEAPAALSENAMRLMRTFLNETDRQTLDNGYTLVETGSQQAAELTGQYPLLATQNIYLRNEDADLESLGHCFGKSSMTFLNVVQQMAGEQGQATNEEASFSTDSLQDVDFAPLYAAQPQLEQMAQAGLMDDARATAEATDPSMLSQMSVVMVKQFYQELGMDVSAIQTNYIWRTGIFMLLLTLLGTAATIGVSFFSTRVAAKVARGLRHDVFAKVESFSNAEFDTFSTASLITRTTNDVMQVQMVIIMGIRMVCYAPIMGIGGVIMAVSKSTSMTWIIAVGVVVLIGLMVLLFNIVMPKFKIVQKLVDKLNLVTRESLSGMMVIRAFNNQKFEEKRFDVANRDLTDTNLFVNRVLTFLMPAMMFIMNIITLAIVWVGAQQIEASSMQVGDMMAFMQYAMQIIMSFLMISMMFIMVPRAAVAADRVDEVLQTKPSIQDPDAPKTLGAHPKGEVAFHDVSFRYTNAEEDVLQHITFTAKPGQTTAFIGSTGSGKSTLINLIPRFYDVTQGSITIDGVDIRDLTQKELRSAIGYVPQKGNLFSGDIASNLRYGKQDATDEQIAQAAQVAQAASFIEETEGGYHNPIAQGGGNVSGGQKQRPWLPARLSIFLMIVFPLWTLKPTLHCAGRLKNIPAMPPC